MRLIAEAGRDFEIEIQRSSSRDRHRVTVYISDDLARFAHEERRLDHLCGLLGERVADQLLSKLRPPRDG